MSATIGLRAAPTAGRPVRLPLPGAAAALVAGMVLLLAALALAFVVARRPARSAARPTAHAVRPAAMPTPPAVEDQRLVPLTLGAARALNAGRPLVAAPLVAARPFAFAGATDARERAIDCLAAAGWYEIGDDAPGQRAVMQVVLNRVRHPVFPASVCGVVFQGSERSTGCQFTFTCDGALVHRTPSAAAWTRARAVAAQMLGGTVDRAIGLATHYHADYVVPYWAASLDKSAALGPHLFYRWRGWWGERAAFAQHQAGAEPAIAALAPLSAAHRAGDAGLPALATPVGAPASLSSGALAPPPAIAVEGVREKSLRGAVVRGQAGAPGADGRYFVQLDADTFPGNYATAAVALCKGRPGCVVLGWRDVGRLGQSLPLSAAQREALTFYYAQATDGAGKALWNCQQVPRANKAQCLTPSDLG